jgi:hypothetical protein
MFKNLVSAIARKLLKKSIQSPVSSIGFAENHDKNENIKSPIEHQ